MSERRVPEHDHAFQLQLGYVGYLGYELKNDGCQDVVHESPLPDANLLFVDRALVFDHDRNQLHALAYACSSQDRESNRQWFEYVEMMLGAITPRDSLAVVDVSSPTRGEPEFRRAKSRYLSDIQTCLERIHDGESYEVCLTNMLELPSLQDPLAVYEALRLHNPTPFGTFMRFPGVDILSSSPERFLHVDTARRVEAKPVKGTVRRGVDAEEDERLKMTLRSEKEEAENLMIVDLLRNDLGKVCEVGSVTVPKLFAIETFSTVHQLVSTVRGVLRPDESAVSCVAAAFPGGSMTGAPKVRTMSIIDEIESGPRGIYSGAIGYFSLNGSADWSIVIRTIVNTPAHATIGVGGAITALSDPEMEFEEIVLKAQGVLGAIAQGDGSIRTEHVGLPSA
jgi:para-aminobenzoate synthetase